MHGDTAFWYSEIAPKRWAYTLGPNCKEELSHRVFPPVPAVTLEPLVVSTSSLAWCS